MEQQRGLLVGFSAEATRETGMFSSRRLESSISVQPSLNFSNIQKWVVGCRISKLIHSSLSLAKFSVGGGLSQLAPASSGSNPVAAPCWMCLTFKRKCTGGILIRSLNVMSQQFDKECLDVSSPCL